MRFSYKKRAITYFTTMRGFLVLAVFIYYLFYKLQNSA